LLGITCNKWQKPTETLHSVMFLHITVEGFHYLCLLLIIMMNSILYSSVTR